MGGGDYTEGLGVARREDRCRPVGGAQHPQRQVARLVAPVLAVTHPLVWQLNVGGFELAHHAGLAVAARREPERVIGGVADQSDPAVAEVEQMAHREHAALDVVADDPRHRRDGGDVDIDEDHRNRRLLKDRPRIGRGRQ